MVCAATMLHNPLLEGIMRHSAAQLHLDSIHLERKKDMQFYHSFPQDTRLSLHSGALSLLGDFC
jgi:hypothetical protein